MVYSADTKVPLDASKLLNEFFLNEFFLETEGL